MLRVPASVRMHGRIWLPGIKETVLFGRVKVSVMLYQILS